MKFWIKKKLKSGEIIYMEKDDPNVIDINNKMITMQYPNGNKLSFVPFMEFDEYELVDEITRK